MDSIHNEMTTSGKIYIHIELTSVSHDMDHVFPIGGDSNAFVTGYGKWFALLFALRFTLLLRRKLFANKVLT